jgi:AcrR family transcriptional regulator
MGIVERREREREEVRRKILDAAGELFARDGYEHVTMRAIAEAIEYSPTTIYHHFEDKDDLVRALCQVHFEGLLAAFEGQGRPEDPIEWIRQLGRAYARFGVSYPNHYRFMFMTPHPHDAPEKVPAGEQTYGLLRQAVERAMASGRFRELKPETVCQVLWSAVHGATALLITYGAQFPHEPVVPDLVDQTCEATLRGLLKGPPPDEES